MNPEEKALLESTHELAEENNKILHKMRRMAMWGNIWGFIKIAVVIVPLTIGYLYLEPYLGQVVNNLNSIRELINTPR